MIPSIEIPDKQKWDVKDVIDPAIQDRSSSFRLSSRSRLPSLLPPKDEDSTLIINEDIEVTEYAPDVFAFLR